MKLTRRGILNMFAAAPVAAIAASAVTESIGVRHVPNWPYQPISFEWDDYVPVTLATSEEVSAYCSKHNRP